MKSTPSIYLYGEEFSPGIAAVVVAASDDSINIKNANVLGKQINWLLGGNPLRKTVSIVSGSLVDLIPGLVGTLLKRSVPKISIKHAEKKGFSKINNSKFWKKDEKVYEEKDGYLSPVDKSPFSLKSLLNRANSKDVKDFFEDHVKIIPPYQKAQGEETMEPHSKDYPSEGGTYSEEVGPAHKELEDCEEDVNPDDMFFFGAYDVNKDSYKLIKKPHILVPEDKHTYYFGYRK